MKHINSLLIALFVFLVSMPAGAGKPESWAIGFQTPASPSAEQLQVFHNDLLMWIITAITIFVTILLVVVIVLYNKRANPKPKQFSHNVLIEVVWTVIPVIILLVIVIPSIKLLYFLDRTEVPDMTLKVTGHQWYWGYEYPDQDGINFNSYMIADDEIDAGKDQLRLLSTDNPIVLPINKNIQILVTAGDVIHSWAVPALGVKIDAVPGRLNETWMRITKPGVYYGQCSELCGKDHSYMPIEIHAVSEREFNAWVANAKVEFGSLESIPDTRLAFANK